MKTKQLVILMFPLSSTDGETISGGKALYVKHVRKNILGVDDAPEHRSLDFVGKQYPTADDHAQDAWLIQMNNTAGLRGADALTETVDYTIVAQTAPFPPKQFDPDLGVYVIGHNQNSVVRLAMAPTDLRTYKPTEDPTGALTEAAIVDANAQAAAGLARVIDKFRLTGLKKLCLVICNPAEAYVEKNFLVKLVEALHEKGCHPKVAGWDLPLTVISEPSSPNYGRKEATGAVFTGLLAAKDMRKKHKFVYVYQETADTYKAGIDIEKLVIPKQTKPYKKEGSVALNPKATTADVTGGKKPQTKVTVSFVQRVKYQSSGWSTST
jgi:hypothetical protein